MPDRRALAHRRRLTRAVDDASSTLQRVDTTLHRHGASCYRLVVRSFANSSAIVRAGLRDLCVFDLAVER